MFRKIASFLLLTGWVLTSALAVAAPRDKAAQKKIEEAIYTNFLNTDFDAAEGLLLGTIRACEDKCSPELIGKAWMYIGVVRGSGRNDLAGATEAFKTAFSSDPNVALDNEIATDPVKAVFAKLKGGGGGAAPSGAEPSAGGGAFTCAPAPTEIETRRPVPMQCETDKELTSAKLFYKSFSGSWASVKMEQHEGTWRGTIPCAATQNTGKLKFYVEGLDDDNKVTVRLGEKEKPKAADIVSETSAEPPAFPEEEAPQRCGLDEGAAAGGSAPPSGEGGECVAYGAACNHGGTCCQGLACISGTCGEAECQSDSDCKNGAECQSGKCEGGEEAGDGTYAKNWIGLHYALDVASISADKACDQASRDSHIACFYGTGVTYSGTPNAAGAGTIKGGFTLATMRLLATYERLFGPVGLEARLGFAFNGGQTPQGGSPFLPVHAEGRVKYWLLGTKAFAKAGPRPWIHLGGGLAQVDATVNVPIADCPPEKNPACLAATSVKEAQAKGAKVRSLDATKQLGQSFVTVGGGLMYAFGKNHGVALNLNFMIPFPSSGFVLEPSLGYVGGF